jgi:hypothetical protein
LTGLMFACIVKMTPAFLPVFDVREGRKMGERFPNLSRSGRFILYFQADGVCNALRLAVQVCQTPGPETVALLQAMAEDARLIGEGNAFDRLPSITEDTSAVDMLVAAEVIRTSMQCFLSPEEVEEQRRVIGFGAAHAEPGAKGDGGK